MGDAATRILLYFMVHILILSVGIGMCLYAVFKKKWKWLSEESQSTEFSSWCTAHPEKISQITLCLKLFLVVCIIPMILYVTAFLMDIPNILHKNYLVITGITITRSLSAEQRTELRSIKIKDGSTWEEIQVYVFTHGIRRGELVTVYVLPITKIGFADRG